MQMSVGIDLRLGTEYHVASDIVESFKSGRCHTLAGFTVYTHRIFKCE